MGRHVSAPRHSAATPPGAFDDEVLHTVRLGEVHAEPPTWGGRGVRL